MNTFVIFLPVPEIDLTQDFKKMRVSELKALLEQHGEECVGCAEKDEVIQKIYAVAERQRKLKSETTTF